ncbi:MAG: hypothetical protein AAB529_02180 [Patescibacteria group bacterium]
MKKDKNQKSLTLDVLIDYNRGVFIPELKEIFSSKKELSDFKNKSLTNQDAMLKKLNVLLTEKEVREYQEKKQKKLWAIIVKSLKEHNILSSKELEEIAKLEIF